MYNCYKDTQYKNYVNWLNSKVHWYMKCIKYNNTKVVSIFVSGATKSQPYTVEVQSL